MTRSKDSRFLVAGLVLGLGLGGFVDGIVLHQILRWHHMVSSLVKPTTLEAVQPNIFWDGIFDISMWAVTGAGIALLWGWARIPHRPWSSRAFLGLLLAGWGVFNAIGWRRPPACPPVARRAHGRIHQFLNRDEFGRSRSS